MPRRDDRPEVLVINGRIDAAGRFTPRRCTSTRHVRRWPEAADSTFVVELVDAEGNVLHREPALVTPARGCGPHELPRFRLNAYIGLRDAAKAVVVRRDDLLLAQMAIPRAPRLQLVWTRRRVSRETPVRLGFRYSEPGPGAFLQVIYQWGTRRFQVVGVIEPTSEMRIDMADRPGGEACRFVVQYSNGMRSAGAATSMFSMPSHGAQLTIVHPVAGTTLAPWEPLVLEGQVVDPERAGGPDPERDLLWLVDREQVGRGAIAGVQSLMSGRHRVTLRYEPDPNRDVHISLSVREPSRPGAVPANEWPEWNDWED